MVYMLRQCRTGRRIGEPSARGLRDTGFVMLDDSIRSHRLSRWAAALSPQENVGQPPRDEGPRGVRRSNPKFLRSNLPSGLRDA